MSEDREYMKYLHPDVLKPREYFSADNCDKEDVEEGVIYKHEIRAAAYKMVPGYLGLGVDSSPLGVPNQVIDPNGEYEYQVPSRWCCWRRIVGPVVFVQDEKGNFQPVKVADLDDDDNLTKEEVDDFENEDECVPLLDQKRKALDVPGSQGGLAGSGLLLRCIFLFAQGLLAGFCYVTLTFRIQNTSDTEFVQAYQPFAADQATFFHLFTTFAFLGSLDSIYNSISSDSTDDSAPVATFVIKIVTVGLYFVCFLSNQIMTRFDTLCYYKGGYTGDWPSQALADSQFKEAFDAWDHVERLRLVSAMIAWLCSCVVALLEGLGQRVVQDKLQKCRDIARTWRTQAKELSGDSASLGPYIAMDDKELAKKLLRRLVSIQEVALGRSRTALASLKS